MSIDTGETTLREPIQTTLGAIFFSMELSRSNWVVTSLSSGDNEIMS
jgi:transposase